MLVFAAFLILMVLTATNDYRFAVLQAKKWRDWILDTAGLFFQGVLIPLFQITVVYQLYCFLLPNLEDAVNLPSAGAFFLSCVFVDYLYYWNHRLFHTPWLWSVHRVHHTMTEMHVLGTSRNTLWTSFLIIYLWIHALFIYLLQDPNVYIVGVSLSSALDLWRHSELGPIPGTFLYRWLSPWLILPHDHAWHHASGLDRGNYGANLKIWDKIHGTCYECDKAPSSLGNHLSLTLIQQLMWPFSH